MQNNVEFCVYGGFNDEVRGVEELPVNSLWDETVYYSAPLEPAYSGSYFTYLNGDIVYNSGYYEEPSYPVYYPFINEYSPDNVYYSYYAFVPVYGQYFVPNYNYSLPRSEYVASSNNSFEQVSFYESPLMSPTVEPNLFIYGEYDSNIYNIQNGSFDDGSVEGTVGEEITTCYISYAEYPENLVEAGNEDEEDSLSSDKKLEENVVLNEANVNEVTVVDDPDEQPDGVYTNCDEEVEENIIKKVSLMSLVKVQKDVDETYEYGKANLYNEVLKGYTENKNTLEDLEWECHTLYDIPEEEEPEDDSDEMDSNENVLNNINLQEVMDKSKFPDVEDSSLSASDSLSEESALVSSQQALIENCEIMVEENEVSTDSSIAEENDTSDPVLQHSLCEEKQYSGSMNGNQEDYPPVSSPVSPTPVSEDKHKMISVPDVCSSREEIHSGSVSGTEEACPYMDSAVIEENCKMNSVQDLCLSKEKIDSVSLCNNEEPHLNVLSEDRGEETPVILEPAASEKKKRKKRFSSLRKFCARMCCCFKKPS